MPPRKRKPIQPLVEEVPVGSAAPESIPHEEDVEHHESSTLAEERQEDDLESGAGVEEEEGEGESTAMSERMTKMAALRKRMADSTKANRKDLISETNAVKANARNVAKLERKKLQLQAMGEKAEALETGEDLERRKAWEYTIEDNEKWDKKSARKDRRADHAFTDYDDIARRQYKKHMDVFKPDTIAYKKARDAANASSSSTALIGTSAAAEDLYRDHNSFVYADHKPTEDDVDRVIGGINLAMDRRNKRSRVRKEDDEGDITYINAKNKHFNKKLERYYDAHTKETRDNFERGTAL